MAKKYTEYKGLNLPEMASEVMKKWTEKEIFSKSISTREGKKPFVFFEGPPSANGLPGIHHVMARTIKDIFCRYKTLKGFQVKRKAGWDTHGLPVELGVEKELGITKEDIGKKISVEEYNQACRKAVMKYTGIWNELTERMGYWVDMQDPYITYDNKYMETVWWLLGQMHSKDLLYKGYTIQPYSPKAGTGLSSHEINQPGCYRDVKDTTIVAQFKMKGGFRERIQKVVKEGHEINQDVHFLAWTTTPWTLPSNTALAVGPKIPYVVVNSYNSYTFEPITVVLAEALLNKHFSPKNAGLEMGEYKSGDKNIPFEVVAEISGSDLVDIEYEQLMPHCQPLEDADRAFRVIKGDFVTTQDGTGIVHIAPTFGADDAQVAKEAGVPPLMVLDEHGNNRPLVNLQGKFVEQMGPYAGKYVKNEYYNEGEAPEKSVDVEIAIQLKEENKAFKVEKYEHSYPHCWRTDTPILYYPLDSWFVKATAAKERMVALNKTIGWKPESTGTGRFGNWLENLNDWNLSRSRFWGIPIPIWRTEEGDEEICISSAEQLKAECQKAVEAGLMQENPLKDFVPGDMSPENYDTFDFHKNFVDKILLVSPGGKPMKREVDLIDVWFDSGSMPYAQWHYPFENRELIDENKSFPADFIAEGVDQTRGWFYTLHAIATMCFDSVAYKNVISNGLVLDKNGQKMSKRLGNAADPFKTLDEFGPDATRWYMITNAQPWDNLKFDLDGITETQRKFFRALHNTYSFFALYANIDGFAYAEEEMPLEKRPEIDRWIISRLNSLIKEVEEAYESFEPTKAGRLIQEFTVDHLSNWYVRLCRRRFWKGEYSEDKIAAYQTLYRCLEVIAQLASPIAPFYADALFNDLNSASGRKAEESVHLGLFPEWKENEIDLDLQERMEIAQKVSSMVLGIRKKENLRVRQPLNKIQVPVLNETFRRQLEAVSELILSEVNVKHLDFVDESTTVIVKNLKLNFKVLGKKYGKLMKGIAAHSKDNEKDIAAAIENSGRYSFNLEGEALELLEEDVELIPVDIPGWKIANEGRITVALDITLNEQLKQEGIARELVNRIQNLRKDSGFEVTDKIHVHISGAKEDLNGVLSNFDEYIKQETLAKDILTPDELNKGEKIDLIENLSTTIWLEKA